MKRVVLLLLLITLSSTTVYAADYSWIHGTPDFRQRVIDTLNFVQRADPTDYASTIRYITLIEQNDSKWSWIIGDNGICKVELSTAYTTWQWDGTLQLAGDLVHEGNLCHDYFDGNTSDVRADEQRALQAQLQFYIHVHAPQYLINYMIKLIAQHWPWGK